MRITWQELTVAFDKTQEDDFLSDWRWLVENAVEILLISSLGDMFLKDISGVVYWLDTGAGQTTKIAESKEHFQRLLQTKENVIEWFIPDLVGDLITSGKTLGVGECFSYKLPPTLGGNIEVDNFEPTDLSVHFSILGQIQKQIR